MNDRITISRWRDNRQNMGINIQIEQSNGTILYSGSMTLEDFAKCVTGFAMQPIDRCVTGSELL